jgi:hypothetical protein
MKEPHPPTFHRCKCVLRGDLIANVERGLKGLSRAEVVAKSPLLEKITENLWVTAEEREFMAHLRHVGLRQPSIWMFRVHSDAELVTAWLATVALGGKDIIDADAHKISTRFLTVPDLAVPPDLLVIRMGVKVARNAAAPEVLAEAINIRYHEDKPTWIWDQPSQPLNAGHLCWSDQVERVLRPWQHLSGLDQPSVASKKARPSRRKGGGGRKSLRGGPE